MHIVMFIFHYFGTYIFAIVIWRYGQLVDILFFFKTQFGVQEWASKGGSMSSFSIDY
jgi:hypothetical protein